MGSFNETPWFIFALVSAALLNLVSADGVNITAKFSVTSATLQIGDTQNVNITFSEPTDEALIYFTYQSGKDVSTFQTKNITEPIENITLHQNQKEASFIVHAVSAGSTIIGIGSNSSQFQRMNETFLRVQVVHNKHLDVFNAVIGWMYFVAWSISFYPQVLYNWRRKSVVGLNFDFLAYNLTGFLAYGVFNVGMYWIGEIKKLYSFEHPRGVNPVQLNDVFFTLHAVLLTGITIFQCFIYERGEQRVSKICIGLLSGAWLFALVTCILGATHVISWLTYVYYFSYIKLGVTLIKYIPQALMNYRRKSTIGWSIGNVLLDCTGGSLSLLQMFLISYNNDSWDSIFGDPTKFGLGVFSILFDILFIVQHYILYRKSSAYVNLQDEADGHTD